VKIIFFDGHCNLCNGFIDFLIRHDHKKNIFYSPLQGLAAKKLGLSQDNNLKSVVFHDGHQVFQKSRAVIHVFCELGGVWSLVKVFKLTPSFILDLFYDLIAKNRYKIFGYKQTCRVPTAAEKVQFLD
jgi:predicted DCC family thiol-disulfide oxidoreductase YuxK